MKPILSLDFDGVIHAYDSGWKGPRSIPDDPVPGALEFIAEAVKRFDVQIFSSRSNYWFGRWAMKSWLKHHYFLAALEKEVESYVRDGMHAMESIDYYDTQARDWAESIVGQIKFPRHKPPALVTIDDRAIQFTGIFPTLSEISAFKPWNKQPTNRNNR